MAIKENIEALKQELSAQEQLLENIIASERFFKRHKRSIIAVAVILVLLLIGYVGYQEFKSHNLKVSNEAYRTLMSDPKNADALQTLKSKNKPLYRAFVFQEAVKTSDNAALSSLVAEDSSDVIGSLAAYQLGNVTSGNILENFAILEEGFALLKEGKTDEASIKFSTIPADSPLVNVVKRLEHYQKKEAK